MTRGHQLQMAVVLRPVPTELLELLTRSLRSLGFELEKRDVQLIEQERSIPHLGIRGRGWRAQIDGVPAARVTVLTHAAGRPLEVMTVELCYGLERLALLQQRADSIDDVFWSQSPGTSYADVRMDLDGEYGRYYERLATAEGFERRYGELEGEIAASLAEGLARPSYDRLLEACHVLEILKARGLDPVRQRIMEKALRSRAQKCLELSAGEVTNR